MEELILRSLQGRTTYDEERSLEEWVEASPENGRRLVEIQKVWNMAERISPSVRSLRRPPAKAIVQDAADDGREIPENEMPVGSPSVPAGRSNWVTRVVLPLAAAAVVAALALGMWMADPPSTDGHTYFGAAEFSTGPEETVTARLDDGSIVRLGPGSTLRLDGTNGVRDVWLSGQAFFAVAHNEAAPFTVRTAGGVATVLGTRFDVRSTDSDLRLVVVDGRVRVSAGSDEGQAEEVGPSQMSQVIEGDRVYVSQVSDVYALLDWMEGSLIFQATPLDQVARELEYRYGVTVEVVDPTVSDRQMTAWFNDESLESAVRVICRAVDVRCDVREDRVLMGL